jgi:hypothetical protein
MYRRLHAQLAAIALLPLLAGGCVQMTRHSNMMIFGTNTVVGVRAGVNATSVPEVSIGYTRQEAVVLPLVANVAVQKDGTRLMPCNVGRHVAIRGPQGAKVEFPIHPCLLVASNGNAKDSYSVLASFGGNFSGEAAKDGSGTKAKAGVAQYFSTGVAAQLLALKGGAAVVAAGDAATKSSETAVDESAVRSLFGGKPEPYSTTFIVGQAFQRFEAELLQKIGAGTDQSVLQSMKDFEEAADTGTTIHMACTSKASCQAAAGSDALMDAYEAGAEKMEAALKGWK